MIIKCPSDGQWSAYADSDKILIQLRPCRPSDSFGGFPCFRWVLVQSVDVHSDHWPSPWWSSTPFDRVLWRSAPFCPSAPGGLRAKHWLHSTAAAKWVDECIFTWGDHFSSKYLSLVYPL